MSKKNIMQRRQYLRLYREYIPIWTDLRFSLAKIKGIGRFLANKICVSLGYMHGVRLAELSEVELFRLRLYCSRLRFLHGIGLHLYVKHRIRMQVITGTYRGRRHKAGLPVHGQRTHSNGRTAKKHKLYVK